MLPKPRSIEEAKAVVRRIGRPEMEFVSSITAPLYWAVRCDDGTPRTRNGSAFFIKTPERTFGVTAAHVIEGENGWRNHCATFGKTPLRLGGRKGNSLQLDWDTRVLDICNAIDIATFGISPEEIATIDRIAFSGLQTIWPPVPPVTDEQVTFCGFAGTETNHLSQQAVEFGIVTGSGLASSVNDRNVSSLIEREYFEPIDGVALPPDNFHFGGISGGPMIYVTERYHGLRLNALAGVVTSGPNTSLEPTEAIAGFELIVARRAHFICANGRLDHRLWATVGA